MGMRKLNASSLLAVSSWLHRLGLVELALFFATLFALLCIASSSHSGLKLVLRLLVRAIVSGAPHSLPPAGPCHQLIPCCRKLEREPLRLKLRRLTPCCGLLSPGKQLPKGGISGKCGFLSLSDKHGASSSRSRVKPTTDFTRTEEGT